MKLRRPIASRIRQMLGGCGLAVAAGMVWGADSVPLPPLAGKYCTACHLPPAPDAMPRSAWIQVFGFMAVWIQERNLPFDQREYSGLLDQYLAASPERLAPIPDDLAECRLTFETKVLGHPGETDRPIVSDLRVEDLDGDGHPEIVVCDAAAGRVSSLAHREGKWEEKPIFDVRAPSRAVVLDYDGDGLQDLAVASLGIAHPTDSLVGSVWLLRNLGDGSYDPQPLMRDCPRVSDVKAGDFNGDGKLDLLVMQFGWRTTGGLLWLEQQSSTTFVSHEIARVHGALQAEVLDFDGDGALDFVVLFAQEHESLVLFRNNGQGGFETRILARGPQPAFGSSGFSMVDLDGDGDLDFIWTNGDMMDEIPVAKPYHGVRWIENRDGEMVVHELARMPGCYRAVAHDLDGDGDLDIAVSSLNFKWEDHDFPSLIWLENDGSQHFTARRIAYSPTNLASLVAGDFDGDGAPDVVAGGMHIPGPQTRMGRITGFLGIRSEEKEPDAGDQRKPVE